MILYYAANDSSSNVAGPVIGYTLQRFYYVPRDP